MNHAIPLPSKRPTDVSTTEAATSMSGAPVADTKGLVELGHVAGAAMRSAGGGGPLVGIIGILAAVVGFGLWVSSEIGQAKQAANEAKAAVASYEARLVRIELSLESFAAAAKSIPGIEQALNRLIDDQRKLTGSVETLEKQLRRDP